MLSGAREIEQVLDLVRELLDRRDAEGTGVPLHGVERPEDVVQQLDVGGRRFELEQDRFDRAEVVERFRHEHRRELGVRGERRELLGVRQVVRRHWRACAICR